MTIPQIMAQANTLSLEERQALIALLQESIHPEPIPPKHSILELAGLGADIWEGIDAQEYVNQLRSEWNERP